MSIRERAYGAIGVVLVTAVIAFSPAGAGVSFAEDGAAPASEKTETVNITANANGEVEKVEVEATLKNEKKADQLTDSTTLTDLEGKDKVSYEMGDGLVYWQAEGNDVTYTGKTDAKLPVTMYVTYRLDGLVVNPSDIAGKSGDVSIRYDFVNECPFTANVNGAATQMYLPFTCIVAIMLDGDDFSDVKVQNGKIINDGSDAIITGYAMPGLRSSLGSIAKDATIPDYVEITAHANSFKLKSSMTIVTAGLLSDLNVDDMGFGDFDDASSGLKDGITELIDGSDQLTEGLQALADGACELDEGVSQFSEGTSTLSQGLYQLAYGPDGKSGLQGAADSSSDLIDAMDTIGTALDTVSDPKEGLPALAAGMEQLADAYPDAKTLAALEGAVQASDLDPTSKQAVIGILESTKQVPELSDAVSQASDAVTTINEGYSELQEGAQELPDGLDQAAEAAKQLYKGSVELTEGAEQLGEGTAALSEGMQQATDGSDELTQGLRTYDDEGISKIVRTIDDDIGGLKKRLSILSNEASAYVTFSGKEASTPGSVKFIYQTSAIEDDSR